MTYAELTLKLVNNFGAERSTLMGSPCLRYQGTFFAMIFEREDALIIKVPAARVTELINDGVGKEFNFTKKRFKEWVLIPRCYETMYESLVFEALDYAKSS